MMKSFFVLANCSLYLLLNLIANEAQSQINEVLTTGYTIRKDVAYGDDEEQQMDLYLSNRADQIKKSVTIVFLHGGGYYYSDKSREERYIEPYLKKGFNVVNMNYRLRRGIATASEDLTTALNYLKDNTDAYDLNLKKTVVTGFSAGGHIATLVGVSQNDKEYPHKLDQGVKIIGIINFSGPVDGLDVVERIFTEHEMEAARKLGVALFPDTEEYASRITIAPLEPITYLDRKDPFIFIWYGGKDDQVPPETFQNFISSLNDYSLKHVVVYKAEAGHSPTKELLVEAYERIFPFIDRL